MSFKKQVLFVVIGGVVLIVGGFGIWAVSNRGDEPYIYIKMNEGTASTTYDSMNNVDATMYGGAQWKNEEDCVEGKCVYLDGVNDYVSIPDFGLE
ncbi:MAG: hypothetical protein PHQ86_06650 [Dehalococcoidales bacterium]|nr:hypothetical protein [Dehalococcoidales bacterium]